jgi:hypothetical protein
VLLTVLCLGVGGLQAHATDQVVARYALVVQAVQGTGGAAAERAGGGGEVDGDCGRRAFRGGGRAAAGSTGQQRGGQRGDDEYGSDSGGVQWFLQRISP